MKTAAVLRSEAKALGITLEGNARRKATKLAWEAQIAEAVASGVATPQKATTYVTKEQAIAAAAKKGYAIEIDSEKFEVRIKNQDVIVTTVWLVSDVVRWCKTAPSVIVLANPEPTIKEENAKHLEEIKASLPTGHSVLVSNGLMFEAVIYQGSQILGAVGINFVKKTPWFRPMGASYSKYAQFPAKSLTAAVCRVLKVKAPAIAA